MIIPTQTMWKAYTSSLRLRLASVLLGMILLGSISAPPVQGQDFETVPEMKAWLAATQNQGPVPPPGTHITIQNWQQYKQFMPPAMIALFAGKYHWKMPDNVEMITEQDAPTPVSRYYVNATEQFGAQTKVLHLADGHYGISSYVAGEPFPNPQEPDKGYKILVNNWYSYSPNLLVMPPEDPAISCAIDRYENEYCQTILFVIRSVGYQTDPGVPRNLPTAPDVYYTQYAQVLTPEQSRYTASLSIFYKDIKRWQELYVFLPSLRRSLRLTTSARCAPFLGTDVVNDDARTNGPDGGITLFRAIYLGRRQILSLSPRWDTAIQGDFPSQYFMPVVWPKPSWARWRIHSADIIDMRRVPSEDRGYCYGARITFLDPDTNYASWEEMYDAALKPWKFRYLQGHVFKVDGIGDTVTNFTVSTMYDVQNNHVTYGTGAGNKGSRGALINQQAPAGYYDYAKYASPSGMALIMK